MKRIPAKPANRLPVLVIGLLLAQFSALPSADPSADPSGNPSAAMAHGKTLPGALRPDAGPSAATTTSGERYPPAKPARKASPKPATDKREPPPLGLCDGS